VGASRISGLLLGANTRVDWQGNKRGRKMKELSTDSWAVIITAIILVVFLLGLVGRNDYEDELAAEAFYYEMVCKGLWPDYKNLGVQCEDIEGRYVGGQEAL